MKITVTLKGITLKITATVEEAIQLIEHVDTTNTMIDGYSIEQYDASNLSMDYIETYKGFKIYKRDYYRWWKTDDFNDKSSLENDIETTYKQIDDHIIRLNTKDI